MWPILSFSDALLLAARGPLAGHGLSVGVSFPGMLVLAIAVGFLIYVFTGSSRLVAGVLFFGLLILMALGFVHISRDEGPDSGRLVELAPQRQPLGSAERGLTATTSLLGVEGRGHSFAYVIGGSPAMAEGPHSPLLALKEPLKRSITDLQRNHRFQVFINVGQETLVPWECDGQSLLTADTHNVVQVMNWIDALAAGAASESPRRFVPRDELYQALALQPDVIYFVTDGKEPPPQAQDLQALQRFNTGPTTVHVIQLLPGRTKEQPPGWLPQLASGHHGKFRQVSIAPPAAEKEPAKASQGAEVVAAPNPAPGKRPAWVADSGQALERRGEIYRAVVTSDFRKGEDRSRQFFDENLLAMTATYIDQVVEKGAGERLTQSPGVRERVLQYLSTNVIKQRYREDQNKPEPIGEGVEQFGLLEFNPQAAEYFRQEWRAMVQERRLTLFAVGVALLLAFVGTIFGYLKTDTATRGYYSGRLKFGTVVIVFVLVAAAVKLIFAILV